MLLPATFDYSFELRDWRRYVSMREGRYYQPVFLLGVLVLPACTIGMVLLFLEMLSSPSSTDVMMLTVMAAMVAFSILSDVFGLIPFGGIRSIAMPSCPPAGAGDEAPHPRVQAPPDVALARSARLIDLSPRIIHELAVPAPLLVDIEFHLTPPSDGRRSRVRRPSGRARRR
ncbi:hypothetical protein Corgl_0034 [Coriobacterium glomerans PW2]|uniref:Uncharacterized protein n=1 Tax=Coriobacterium glomerans (strain ATCC 49209 / DSM 20642 / JCM 10262 / PW2) TaxID=700015 RepID=F2N6W4_CORGP|nr:hypothetical protein [Coriobacterium glomerans]AEB06163.1 hypothetical protein Corgl_0034 [Coriobacterium glomerans PW2]